MPVHAEWYPVAAAVLALLVQFVRKFRLTARVWDKCPEGWKWVLPVVSGAVTGFITAQQSGASWKEALMAAAYGAVGIGAGAMGIHAAVKDSPLPIDGRAGGRWPIPPNDLDEEK